MIFFMVKVLCRVPLNLREEFILHVCTAYNGYSLPFLLVGVGTDDAKMVVDEFNSESTDSQLNAEHWFARIKKSYHRNSCLIIITNYLNLKMPIMH